MDDASTLLFQRELERALSVMRVVGCDTQRFEIKKSAHGLPKDIARTLSAFSNGSGGYIVLGVSEEDGFIPVEGFDYERMQDALANVCHTKLTPPVRPEIRPFELDGSLVLGAKIPEMHPKDKPCYISASSKYDGSYIRTGDGDRKLTPYEVDRLLDEHVQPRYDKKLVEDATLDDLDPNLVSGLLKRERLTHARNFSSLADNEALKKLNVVKLDAEGQCRPTLAGLLALGAYPQQYFPRLNISFACYPGTTKADVLQGGQRLLDSSTIVGPISFMVEEAIAAIMRNTRIGAVIDGAFRKDVPEYPEIALREAIVNALMHRDYSPESQGMPVQLDLYADRLEISNPGGLYGVMTLDMLGKEGVSSSRNQFLANILESTPYGDGGYVAENRGTGYQTIEANLSKALMPPPMPRNAINMFKLTFEKRRLSLSERKGASGSDLRAAILEALSERNSISTSEIMKESGRSRPTVVKCINLMLEEGLLEPTELRNSPKQRYRLSHA